MEYPIEFVSKFTYEDYRKCLRFMRRQFYIAVGLLNAILLLPPLLPPFFGWNSLLASYGLAICIDIGVWIAERGIRKRSHYERQFRLSLEGQRFAFYPTHFTVGCEREGYRSQVSLAYCYIYSAKITPQYILLFNSPNMYYYLISLAELPQPQREALTELLRQNIRQTEILAK